MPLLNLIAKLGLDNSEFHAKLGESEHRANIFAKRFAHSFTHEITKYATVGFGLGALKSVIDDAEKLQGITEQQRQVLLGIRETGMSFKETWQDALASTITAVMTFFQILYGRFHEFRATLNDLVNLSEQQADDEHRITAQEKILEQKKRAKQLNEELRKQTADINRGAKLMTHEEREQNLKKEMGLILEELLTTRDPVKAMEGLLEYEGLRRKLLAMKPEFKTQTFPEQTPDPLARIGGFTGGGNARLITIQEKIERNTREIADNIEDNSVGF